MSDICVTLQVAKHCYNCDPPSCPECGTKSIAIDWVNLKNTYPAPHIECVNLHGISILGGYSFPPSPEHRAGWINGEPGLIDTGGTFQFTTLEFSFRCENGHKWKETKKYSEKHNPLQKYINEEIEGRPYGSIDCPESSELKQFEQLTNSNGKKVPGMAGIRYLKIAQEELEST